MSEDKLPLTDNIEKLENQLRDVETQKGMIDAINALALALCEDDLERAYSLAIQANQLSQTDEYENDHYFRGMAESLHVMAWFFAEYKMDFEAGLGATSRSIAFAKVAKFKIGEIRAIHRRGLIYHNVGHYPNALGSYLEALDLARQIGDQVLEAQSLRGIALVYSATEDFEQMLTYTQMALEIFAKLNDDYYYPLLLNNLSMCYFYLERYEEALTPGLEALEIFRQNKSWSGQATVEDTLARSYAAMGDFDQAIAYMRQCLSRLEDCGQPSRYILGLLSTGKILLQKEDVESALPYLHQALAIAEKIGSKPSLFECHQALSVAYEEQGELAKALSHHRIYQTLYRAVVNESSIQQLKLLEVVHRTEQAQSEAEIQRKLREQERQYFERLSRMRDQLISTTSHDLKNPLTAINNYVFLLGTHETTQDDKGKHYLRRIEAQVDQMRDLIGDLVDLAKLETGPVLNLEDVGLDAFMSKIIADYRTRSEKKNVRLDATIHPRNLSAQIDPRQMRRVLGNLISNAIKFTRIGGTAQVTITQNSSDMIIVIEDDGIGIPADDLPHIFDRFYRVESDAHANIDGQGLGLAIVKSIVEQHGGSIAVESVFGKGTRFELFLPAVVNQSVNV